jgi:hypothetical protein
MAMRDPAQCALRGGFEDACTAINRAIDKFAFHFRTPYCVAHMALDFAESSSATHESDDPADSPQPCRKIIAFWIDFVTFGYKVSSQGVVTHMALDFA